uniref:Saposin B-type domain-containing protein n=1 Tax=Neogobius melanostomus TaxID=47308 RepID=A0A8C6S8X9_9GOBI
MPYGLIFIYKTFFFFFFLLKKKKKKKKKNSNSPTRLCCPTTLIKRTHGFELFCHYFQLPGLCWTCKWVMNKTLTSKLLSVCDKIGFLKSRCQKFVKAKLQVLVEELSTTDDVHTICVNVKELSDMFQCGIFNQELW